MKRVRLAKSVFDEAIFNAGCAYIVSQPGDICNKCGSIHDLTQVQAMQACTHMWIDIGNRKHCKLCRKEVAP